MPLTPLIDQPPAGLNLPRDVTSLVPPARIERLENGLVACVVDDRRAPIVATAVVYRAGARDEDPRQAGAAHFLEHMMFKGSRHYGPGEIDRLTRALGGSNNAFTSHDATLYYFTFAADRWRQALEIEADRMAGIDLDPAAVDAERQVILEELALYESEPWEALEQQVAATFFGSHPYGRPVLGSRESLATIDGAVLGAFHDRYYRPPNAVVVVAGDVGPGAFETVAKLFGPLTGGAPPPPAPAPAPVDAAGGDLRRVGRRRGEVARLLLSLPAPGALHEDHPLLLLLSSILGSGRSSRLYRALVDEQQLCAWITAELQETLDPGALVVALEAAPGVSPQRIEDELLRLVRELAAEGPRPEEVARAQKILLADWIFSHERVQQLAFLMGSSLALFDAEHPRRYLERLLAIDAGELGAIGERYLRLDAGGVLGWSLPES